MFLVDFICFAAALVLRRSLLSLWHNTCTTNSNIDSGMHHHFLTRFLEGNLSWTDYTAFQCWNRMPPRKSTVVISRRFDLPTGSRLEATYSESRSSENSYSEFPSFFPAFRVQPSASVIMLLFDANNVGQQTVGSGLELKVHCSLLNLCSVLISWRTLQSQASRTIGGFLPQEWKSWPETWSRNPESSHCPFRSNMGPEFAMLIEFSPLWNLYSQIAI